MNIHEMVNRVTRLEVIDDNGRQFTRWDTKIGLSFQDDGRTLKVFVGGRVESADQGAPESAQSLTSSSFLVSETERTRRTDDDELTRSAGPEHAPSPQHAPTNGKG